MKKTKPTTRCTRLTYATLSKMAADALWAQSKAMENGLWDQAIRYGNIWIRIKDAMYRNIMENNYNTI